MLTTLHYGDALNTPRDNAFRLNYAKAYKLQPDVYAVQGYDAAQMLSARAGCGEGRLRQDGRHDRRAMEKAKIDSPRGTFTLGKSHNPVQDIYLRKVEGKENKVVGVAVKGARRSGTRLPDVDADGCNGKRIKEERSPIKGSLFQVWRVHNELLPSTAYRDRRSADITTRRCAWITGTSSRSSR